MITIRHTRADGTLIEGSRKGDGVWEVLKGLRANWKYSRDIGLYLGQSRDKRADTYRINAAADALRTGGHEVTVEINEDEARSFAEAEADRYARAEERAGRMAQYAGNAATRSAAGFATADRIMDMIPMGQPILVGHHSERRHRKDLERIDRGMRTGVEEGRKAEHYEHRADLAENMQAGREDVPTTLRRIAKLEAELRGVKRSLIGDVKYEQDEAGDYKPRLVRPSGEWLAELERRKSEHEDQIAYWRDAVARAEANGAKVWGPADFTKGDFTLVHGSWAEVLRVNRKSVSVAFGVNFVNVPVVTKAKAAGQSWTLDYDKVTARKSAEELAA